MTGTPTPCIRGCTIPDAHGPDCTCADDGHEHVNGHHDHPIGQACDDACRWCDECAGCLPRPATVGQPDPRLCQACGGRARLAILDAGDLVQWVRDNVVPGTWRPGDRGVLREAPAPLTEQAVDDADAIHAALADWVIAYTLATGLTGPSWAGSAIRPQVRRVAEDGTTRYDDARVIGLRAAGDHRVTARLAGWTLTHLEGFAGQSWAGDWHDEIVTLTRQVSGRWPREDRVRKLPIPCPSCDRVMLYMHPPASPPIIERGVNPGEHLPTCRHRVCDLTPCRPCLDRLTRPCAGCEPWERIVYAADHVVCCHLDRCGRAMTEADYYLRAQTLLAERKAATG